jgi:hypothetical protein
MWNPPYIPRNREPDRLSRRLVEHADGRVSQHLPRIALGIVAVELALLNAAIDDLGQVPIEECDALLTQG